MKRSLGVIAAVFLASVACHYPPPPTNNQNVNVNVFGPSGGPGVVTPAPGTAPAKVNLGCFGMVGSGPSECAALLADYNGSVGTKGTLDATPLDANGLKVNGLSVEGWQAAPLGGICTITGETSGPDGFNPEIELTDVGCCSVSVVVAGVPGGPRKFCAS
jgi:hypothetical protein